MQKEVNEERGKGRMGQLKEDWREKEAREKRIKEREIKYKRNKSKKTMHVSRTSQQTQKANSSVPVEVALRSM